MQRGAKMSGRNRRRKSAHFSCLGDAELGPGNTEVPANEVNYALGYINLANILGARDWERKNWAKEWPIIIDT